MHSVFLVLYGVLLSSKCALRSYREVLLQVQESELTPSGANLLDGRYAVFGYVVEGQDLLTQLQVVLLLHAQFLNLGGCGKCEIWQSSGPKCGGDTCSCSAGGRPDHRCKGDGWPGVPAGA